ncbi:hypothetical protein KSP40_PGU014941 [Platanthera guangdongensis]|uniref:Uncharacterized protein n=1 Tax=Platanthera guangdongensis TaxID=2320717 RepID=A0ABR2M8E0_9ASPA
MAPEDTTHLKGRELDKPRNPSRASSKGHPFCSGVTLSKLVFSTIDEQDNETFDASGALDKLHEMASSKNMLFKEKTTMFWVYNTRLEVSHLSPDVPVLEDTHAWWRYAMLASLQQKKLCCWFSWERIKHLCQLRRLYIQMYSTFLKESPSVDIYAMRKIERSLDSEVVLLWSGGNVWPRIGRSAYNKINTHIKS